MAQSELNVTSRTRINKGGNRSLRRIDQAPAVVYGKGIEPCAIAIVPKEFKKALATESGLNTLITLKGEGPFNNRVVIVKDIQYSAIRRDITHVDFQAIDLHKKVHVLVPVRAIGKSQGEKDGGSLQLVRHEVEIVCLPTAIPKSIDIDVVALKIGDVVHVNDLKLAAGIEAPHDVNFAIITVIALRGSEAEEEGQAKKA